jgi:cold shock protein
VDIAPAPRYCSQSAAAELRQLVVAKRPTEEEITVAEGTIKRLTDKGFGFIATGKGDDIFFHMSNLDGVRFEELREGQKVSYVEGRGPKGPRAEQVRPL